MGEIEHRMDYDLESLEESDLASDPFVQFEAWYQRAVGAGLMEPNALVLATVGASGAPTQRTVLLKYFDHAGWQGLKH